MKNCNYNGLKNVKVHRFLKGTWETIEDVVSDERRLFVEWRDELTDEKGQLDLWSWPYDLAHLALGHVLLDIRPKNGTLTRQCSVSRQAEDKYLVRLGAMNSTPPCEPLCKVTGETIFNAMNTFINADSQWKGTGCFHQAGIFDPVSKKFLARAEDIGRHNCLDRLAGWSALNSVSLSQTILLTSARITASLCAKALRAGFQIMVSRSAVTSASMALAKEHSISLVGFARTDEQRLTLFADPLQRIVST